MNKRIKKKKGLFDCPKCGGHMKYMWIKSNRSCGVIHKGDIFKINPVYRITVI